MSVRCYKFHHISEHTLSFHITFRVFSFFSYLTLVSKVTYSHSPAHSHNKATAHSSRAVRVRYLAQGHLNTQLRGAGDGTSNLFGNKSNCSIS